MTRDENVLGFKPYITIYRLIWKLSFLFKHDWFGIDDFLLNFFATFVSVFGTAGYCYFRFSFGTAG